jgi:hypothetical protein
MKIRSLKTYIKQLTGKEPTNESEIGNTSEPFLRKIYGDDDNIEQIITGIANFATDVEEQIFYELVQNAYDAEANALLFYANEDYLFVINNGEPFYTDNTKRKGQLYEFLAKNKSNKWNDENQMGKYGQGSKLLYKLIEDEILGKSEKNLLKVIKEEKKGPYILSWQDEAQLFAFLQEHRDWEIQDPANIKDGLLFAKVIYTYYPVTPVEYPNLFTNKEVESIRKVFSDLVQPERNKNLFQQGTALIIPLGKGKYQKLRESSNIKKVKKRLSGVVALIGKQAKNKKIERLYLLDESINPVETHAVFVECQIDNDRYNYQFAFNEIFAESGCVNFYKHLPISDSQFNFGFLINCADFEVDNGRQRIENKQKTKQQLQIAFEELVKKLEAKKTNNDKDFSAIYNSFICTEWKKNKDSESSAYVMQVFEKTLLKFIVENIRTKSGDYIRHANVYQSDMTLNIPLLDLGIPEKYWIDPAIIEKLDKKLGITIELFSLVDVVKEANAGKLEQWIKLLPENDYKVLFEKLNARINEIKNIKFLRSNKGNLFSYEEAIETTIETKNIYFITRGITTDIYDADLEIEYIPYQIKDVSYEHLLNKISAQIEYLSSSDTLKCIVINLLNVIAQNQPEYKNKILGLHIFKNQFEKQSFKNLFATRPEKETALFDPLVVSGFIPPNTNTSWFLSTPKEQWDWIKNNLQVIKKCEWGKCALKNLEDLKKLSNNHNQWTADDCIFINLDKNGNPTDDMIFLKYAEKLEEQEYQQITAFFSEKGSFIPRQFYQILSSKPFKPQKKLSINDLISDETIIIPENIFESLIKIKGIEEWFAEYHIEKTADGFKIIRLKPTESNYYTQYGDSEISKLLTNNGFYNIPEELQMNDCAQYCIERNPELARKIVEKINKVDILLPIIKASTSDIKTYFIGKIPEIELSKIDSQNSLEWQILKFSVQENKQDDIKHKLLFNRERLPDSIKPEKLTVQNGHEYDVTRLISTIRDENSMIEKVWEHIPDQRFFKQYFITEEVIDIEKVFKNIFDCKLDIYKLQFCLDYAILNELKDISLQKSDNLKYSDILEMVKTEQLKHFDTYLKLPDFNSEIQFEAEAKWLLEEEKLPDYLSKWLNKYDTEARRLLSCANEIEGETSKYIQIRKCLLDNTEYTKEHFEEDCPKLQNTIKWILKQDILINQETKTFEAIDNFILSLPKTVNPRYLLQYTGNFDKTSAEFKFIKYQEGSPFLDKQYLSKTIKKELAANNAEIKNIFENRKIYYKNGDEILSHFSIINSLEMITETNCAENHVPKKEWPDKVYQNWKAITQKTIYLSEVQLGIEIHVRLGKELLYSKSTNAQPFFWNEKDKHLIIHSPNNNKTILKALEEHQSEISGFAQDFIKLQSMFLDELNKDELNKIADTYTEKEIRKITEDKDKIKKIISEKGSVVILEEEFEKLKKSSKNKEDSEDGPEIEPIYGYIGELLYEEFLKKSEIKYEYAAEKEVNEYDFIYCENGEKIHVDIKTTISSLRNGTAPLYIHKTQYPFMKKHPNYDYRIVRISLEDMKINKDAKKIKKRFHKKDPHKDTEIQVACKEIVKKYWEKYSIQQFKETIHEYKVKIADTQ